MSGPVLRLPGVNCRHYAYGRCLYEEHLNPGYDQSVRCEALARLVSAYDDFLRRCEALGLSEKRVAELLNERLASLGGQETCCHAGPRGATNLLEGCEHSCQDVCLLKMPRCPGQCPNYVLQRTKPRG
ncbi:hypothetical protein JCM15519_05400 [Fundidesulfovibrio butyratiphilus]